MRNKGWMGVALALVLAGWLVVAGDAWSQDQPTGLDIVFVVDQSGSMGGTNMDCARLGQTPPCGKHPEANDPNGLRFYGVEYAAEWLGRNQWLLHPDATFQVAVVNFGTQAKAVNLASADLPSYWATIEPGNEDAWLRQLAYLQPKLAPGILETSHMGNTDVLAAFELAQGLFAELDAADQDQGTHRRAIVVLTDGQPYQDEETHPNFSVGGHMQSVLELAQSSFPADRYSIYVVALNDTEAYYWTRSFAQYWADVTGDPQRAQLVQQNKTDVGFRFREILLELTAGLPGIPGLVVTDEPIEQGPVVIPPYLAEVEFTFFKSDPEAKASVVDTDGNDVKTSGSSDVTVQGETGPIEKVIVRKPLPGQWMVLVPADAEAKVTMQKIQARGKLIEPTTVQYKGMPAQVVYQIVDLQGQPLPDYADSRYALNVITTMQSGGQSWQVNLRAGPDSKYQGAFVPSIAGPHIVDVEAISQDLNGQRIEVFMGVLNPFEVRALAAESRTLGNQLTQYVPASLSFGVVDSANLSAPVAGQLTAEAVLTDTVGQSWPVPLQASQSDELTGSFTPVSAGLHQVHLLARTRDAQGQEYVPLSVAMPPVDVVAPAMVVQLAPGPYKQHGTITVTYELQDAAGNPLALDPAYVPQIQAYLEAGADRQAVTPQQTAPGVLTAVFSPTAEGPQALLSTFLINKVNSTEQVKVAEARHDFFVNKTTLVDVQFAGSTHSSQPVTTVLNQARPLVVEVQLVADGKPVQPSDVMRGSPASPFVLRVHDEEGQDRTDAMTWIPTSQADLFRAEGEGLGPGQYIVEVSAQGELKDDYLYRNQSQQMTIRRTINTAMVAWAAGLSLLLLGLLIAAIVALLRSLAVRKHPCQGLLVIADSTGKILWQKNLADEKRHRNHWQFDLAAESARSLIETLVVTCTNQIDSEGHVVNIQATLRNGNEVGLRRAMPHELIEIVPGTTWFIQDGGPEDLKRIVEAVTAAPGKPAAPDATEPAVLTMT